MNLNNTGNFEWIANWADRDRDNFTDSPETEWFSYYCSNRKFGIGVSSVIGSDDNDDQAHEYTPNISECEYYLCIYFLLFVLVLFVLIMKKKKTTAGSTHLA